MRQAVELLNVFGRTSVAMNLPLYFAFQSTPPMRGSIQLLLVALGLVSLGYAQWLKRRSG